MIAMSISSWKQPIRFVAIARREMMPLLFFCGALRSEAPTARSSAFTFFVIRCAPSRRKYALRCCIQTKWTRRKFIDSGFAGTAAASGLISADEIARAARGPKLSAADEAVLKTASDEIIPAGDGMPSTSEVGGVEYLATLMHEAPDGIGKEIREALTALNDLSKQRAGASFDRLEADDRVSVLKSLESSSPHRFTMLRDSVYEAYYTNPKVWHLIGYELFPTDHAGPQMKPFDEKILSTVRHKAKYYREP
jgi:hypothetical protein